MKKLLTTIICAMVTVAAWAQATVTGTVFEPSGEPAIGATVREKGHMEAGASTDIEGKFSIRVSSPESTLIVSYIGMESREVSLDGRVRLDIHMKEGSTLLEEVMVVGYGTQKKINATGSVRSIGSGVLESRPISNAVQGLQGAVAGLNITNDGGGAPGSEMSINIRGVGSIGEGSDSKPLVLIDGMEGDLSTINPNDIAGISVLKDAAAASIYGSRAPFGVILVTTKGGTRGTRVTYTGNVRFQEPVSVPDPVDSYTWALMCNDAWSNAGGNPYFSAGALEKILKFQRGELRYATGASKSNPSEWYKDYQAWGNTNWYDVYMKKVAVSHEHNLSVTGGGDKVSYYFSGNYLDQAGIFNYADEKYRRMAFSGKVSVKFNDYVSFRWTSRLIWTSNDKPSALNALFYHNLGRRIPTNPVKLPNGDYSPENMIASIEDGGRQKQNTLRFYNQAGIVVTPVRNVDWAIHAEVNSRLENNPFTRQFSPIGYTGPDGSYNYIGVFNGVEARHSIDGSGNFIVNPAAGEKFYEKAFTKVNYFSTNFYTDYSISVNDRHNMKFLIGSQTEYYQRQTDRMAHFDILDPDKPFIPSEVASGKAMVSEVKGEWSTMGVFARVNYNYMNRYMAEVNVRADGASRFPRNQRWGWFPSFSLGWNAAQETFWENWSDVCDYLKLRGSYGVLGNQNTTSFYPYYQKMVTSGADVVIDGKQVNKLPVYAPYSTRLTWEKIHNWGAGLDFAFLRSKLQGSFDLYERTTKDMVGPARAFSAVFGGAAPRTNNAEMRTRGWELELSWRDRVNDDWSYSVSASLSDYRSKITKYDSPDGAISGWYAGKDYGEIWGYDVVGIAGSDDEMRAYLAEHSQSNINIRGGTTVIGAWGGGDLMYLDRDNNGSVDGGSQTVDDHGDLRVIGNETPRYAYSFTLEAKWRFIDLRAYFQGIGKRDYFIGTSTFFGYGANAWQATLFKDHLDYFRYAGSELGANLDPYYGRIRTDANNVQVCDRYLQDASYLRLKNLTLGISLPGNAKVSKYVQKARLYFSAENLFTWTKLKIFDPEALYFHDADYDCGAGKTYPQYRTYSVGLELTF